MKRSYLQKVAVIKPPGIIAKCKRKHNLNLFLRGGEGREWMEAAFRRSVPRRRAHAGVRLV